MFKRTQTIRRQKPMSCLSVFDDFVWLTLKGLIVLLLMMGKWRFLMQVKKLSTCFNMKDKTAFYHEHDIVYCAMSPGEFCFHDYVGETGRGVLELVNYHNGRDTFPQIFNHLFWLLNPFDLSSYSSELRKTYTLRLMLMCLEVLGGNIFLGKTGRWLMGNYNL